MIHLDSGQIGLLLAKMSTPMGENPELWSEMETTLMMLYFIIIYPQTEVGRSFLESGTRQRDNLDLDGSKEC